jgi:nucleoid-associated protein YgaU
MKPTTINCPCGYGNNLGPESKTCPICGLNLEPLHRIHSLPAGYFKLGRDCYEQKDFIKARQYFSTYLSLSDDPVPELFDYLGLSSLGAKDYEAAVKYLKTAVEKNPGNQETNKALNDLERNKIMKRWQQGIVASLLIILPVCCIAFILLTGRGKNEIKRLENIITVKNEMINSKSVQAPKSDLAIQAKTSASLVYHVRPGETLSLISYSIYGTDKKWDLIFNANKDKITDPDILDAQSSIIIPLAAESLQH